MVLSVHDSVAHQASRKPKVPGGNSAPWADVGLQKSTEYRQLNSALLQGN